VDYPHTSIALTSIVRDMAAQVSLTLLLAQNMAVIPSATTCEDQTANLATLNITLNGEEITAIATLDWGEYCANPDFAPARHQAEWGPSLA
jgi:diketogulonate reductase-like aldo/keto reductase